MLEEVMFVQAAMVGWPGSMSWKVVPEVALPSEFVATTWNS
jgi:hypothetical protein